ncbi:hypothetical protein [Paenibacillus thiaminolyticus]|uniref:hypothetical protein n=1 Tax=Paenibacillus thiaminolyticus TaxID=49283 RepID=UPI000B3B4831|nr:hypothetical protein [Paenibacillus thiaminolyticus]
MPGKTYLDGGEGEPIEADGVIISVADASRVSGREQVAFVSTEMEGTAIHGKTAEPLVKMSKEWLFSVCMPPVHPTGRAISPMFDKRKSNERSGTEV